MKEQQSVTIPYQCAVCNSCRLVVSGSYGCSGPGSCIYGGPFTGYQQIGERLEDANTEGKKS